LKFMAFASNTMRSKGIVLLVITTLIWGTSFPLLKHTLTDLPPETILALRFAIASIVVIPWLRNLNRRLLRDGVLLGCLYFAECTAALVGLETISASRSAFIVSLNVILVPLFGVVLGHRISSHILTAAGLAIAGIGVMSWEGGGFGYGDALTIACAVGVAIYILTLEAVAPRHPTLPLVAVQLVTMSGLSMVWAAPTLLGHMPAIASHGSTLLYLGLVVTATPIWTQALAQRWIASHETALLYTLEPVFAALFSLWLLGEKLGLRGLLGAGLILMAMTLSQRDRTREGA
jgi:drug/metabolite transporter (DMT)-like permease